MIINLFEPVSYVEYTGADKKYFEFYESDNPIQGSTQLDLNSDSPQYKYPILIGRNSNPLFSLVKIKILNSDWLDRPSIFFSHFLVI